MPTLLNVETANVQFKVTDNVGATAIRTLPITVNRSVPAGASALGYGSLLYSNQPATTSIYTGACRATVPGVAWSSGWPFNSTPIPPASSLYTMSASGVLQMYQAGGGTGPSSTTPGITGAQLYNSTINAPVASTLPLFYAGNGYCISGKLQSSVADTTIRPTIFTFPTAHNVNTPYAGH